MWKKLVVVLAIAMTAPALVNCTASGSGSVKPGEEQSSGSSTSGSTSGSTTSPTKRE